VRAAGKPMSVARVGRHTEVSSCRSVRRVGHIDLTRMELFVSPRARRASRQAATWCGRTAARPPGARAG
jgi:hypothetical protein